MTEVPGLFKHLLPCTVNSVASAWATSTAEYTTYKFANDALEDLAKSDEEISRRQTDGRVRSTLQSISKTSTTV